MVLRIVSFKIEDSMLEELDYYSSLLGLSRSEFIRMAIERLIKEIKSLKDREHILSEVVADTIVY